MLKFVFNFAKIKQNKGVVGTNLCDEVNILDRIPASSEMTGHVCGSGRSRLFVSAPAAEGKRFGLGTESCLRILAS